MEQHTQWIEQQTGEVNSLRRRDNVPRNIAVVDTMKSSFTYPPLELSNARRVRYRPAALPLLNDPLFLRAQIFARQKSVGDNQPASRPE